MKLNIKNFFVYSVYSTLIICIFTLFFNLKYSTEKMINELDNILPHIRNENWEITKSMFNNFNKDYKPKIENFSFFLNNKEINEALLQLTDIFSSIEIKNKDNCLNKVEILKFYISNFYKSQIPNTKNLF